MGLNVVCEKPFWLLHGLATFVVRGSIVVCEPEGVVVHQYGGWCDRVGPEHLGQFSDFGGGDVDQDAVGVNGSGVTPKGRGRSAGAGAGAEALY